MTDTTTTPNMNMPVPVPSVAPGPAWAAAIVSDMSIIDSHNHTSGQGVQIPPDGLNINADLTFGSNNATNLKSARFTAQSAPLSGGNDLGCVYVSGKDLYYNDEDGNQVRITTGGSVNAGAGSITGLPSGTASVAYSGGTYTFQSATSTAATISCGPVAIGSTTASAKQTTLASNAAQAADISLVLPTTAPGATSYLSTDASGNMSWNGKTGTGSVVLATNAAMTTPAIYNPTLTVAAFVGASSGTLAGGAFSPTVTWTKSSGASLTLTTNTTTAYFHRINQTIIVYVAVNVTVTGYTGSTGSYYLSTTIPLSTTSLTPTGMFTSESFGSTGPYGIVVANSTTGAKWNTSASISANGTTNCTTTYSYLIV